MEVADFLNWSHPCLSLSTRKINQFLYHALSCLLFALGIATYDTESQQCDRQYPRGVGSSFSDLVYVMWAVISRYAVD